MLKNNHYQTIKYIKYFYIDEIQFYKDADIVCEMLANMGKHVVVSGLQGDYNRQIFPNISKLFPLIPNEFPEKSKLFDFILLDDNVKLLLEISQ